MGAAGWTSITGCSSAGGEDPATGSASGCAIAYLVRHGVVGSGVATVFEQGVEMGRPSRLEVRATLVGDAVREVQVGGRTIPVATRAVFSTRLTLLCTVRIHGTAMFAGGS